MLFLGHNLGSLCPVLFFVKFTNILPSSIFFTFVRDCVPWRRIFEWDLNKIEKVVNTPKPWIKRKVLHSVAFNFINVIVSFKEALLQLHIGQRCLSAFQDIPIGQESRITLTYVEAICTKRKIYFQFVTLYTWDFLDQMVIGENLII